jgi:hypothetical protein
MVTLSGGTLALLCGMAAQRVPVRGWPAALLLVWVLGLLVSAVVPTDPPGWPEVSTAALVHRYASVAAFVALPAAVLVLAARLRRGVVRWMSLVTLLRRLVAACAVGVAALWYVAYPGERVLMGLVERGLVAVELAILLALAMRLLRVTTTIPAEHRIRTLMHDPRYRLSVASEGSVYNQPPRPSFFLDDATETYPPPRQRTDIDVSRRGTVPG